MKYAITLQKKLRKTGKIRQMKRIIGIGNALVDALAVLNDDELLSVFGLPKGGMTLIGDDEQLRIQECFAALDVQQATGGSAGNTMLALANLSVRPGFIGTIGDDNIGNFFADNCAACGITPYMVRLPRQSGIAYTFISPDGERTFATYLGAAAMMAPENLTEDMFAGYDYLYVEGYLVQNHALILRAVELAKAAGLKVCLDLASYNIVASDRDFFNHLLTNYVDIVFANEDESYAFTHLNPEESVRAISEQCQIAVVKVGKNGSYVKSGEKQYHIGAITTSCTDSTGAGDLFAGGFLHALSDGFDIRRCAEIGTIAAGRVVEIVGTKLSDETWDEIRRICALYRGFMQKYTND